MWLWLVIACGAPQREPISDSPAATPAPPLPAPGGDPAAAAPPTVAPSSPPMSSVPPGLSDGSAYARLRGRVEEPEKAGECKVDADCAAAGCSHEVCTTTAGGATIMSTCEVLPLFSQLDACGCHDGACTWTLKAGGPNLQPIKVPGDAPQ